MITFKVWLWQLWRFAGFIARDLLLLAALGCITAGLWLWSIPLALVTLGSIGLLLWAWRYILAALGSRRAG